MNNRFANSSYFSKLIVLINGVFIYENQLDYLQPLKCNPKILKLF